MEIIIPFFIIVHSITAFCLLVDGRYIGEAYSVGFVNVDSPSILLMLGLLFLGYALIYFFCCKSNVYISQRTYIVYVNKKNFDYFFTIDLAFNFVLFFKYGVGSSVNSGTSSLTFLTSIFSVRALFPFYYIIQRGKRMHFIVNILLFASLRLLQGWTGFLLSIVIIEVCLFFKDKFFSIKKIVLSWLGSLGLILCGGWIYSLLYPLKFYIRFNQSELHFISLKEGVLALLNRLSFFSQAIASIQTVEITRDVYLNNSVWLGEIKAMLRPIFPGAIMDKSFSSLSLCIKQSFVSYRAQGTSLNVGLFSYLFNLMYSDFLSFLLYIFIISLLIYIFKKVIFSIYIRENRNDVLFFLFLLNILHVSALESVFSYEYIPILLMTPFIFFFKIFSVYKTKI